MPVDERALTAQEQREFKHQSELGMRMIGRMHAHVPADITAAVHDFVARHQRSPGSTWAPGTATQDEPGIAAAARALGTLWGDQLVRALGWEWVCVRLGREERFAVVPPSRALAVFAAEYVELCMDSNDSDCAIQPAFELLRAKAMPPQQARSYTSAMRLVHLHPGFADLRRAHGASSAERWMAGFLAKIGVRPSQQQSQQQQSSREGAGWISA